MMDAMRLIAVVGIVLIVVHLPGLLAVRALGGSRLTALGVAPALGAATAGLAAMLAAPLGIPWSLLPFAAAGGALILAAHLLARCGARLPAARPHADGSAWPRTRGTRARGTGALWGAALVGALGVAIVPIAVQAGRADAVLERYDALYHLNALARIQRTGDGSSLTLNALASTTGEPSPYPAAFHDLASLALLPGISVPVVLNGTVLALAVVPWVLGMAILTRVLFPAYSWAPLVAALGAALVPASPLDLWIHLAPIPNLVGFAMLPGALAASVALWSTLVPTGTRTSGGAGVGAWVAATAVIVLAGLGLALLQPNTAVTALLLLAVLTTVTGWAHWRVRPLLTAVPLLALVPIAALVLTPLGARVTGFTGGLQVPWWSAVMEVGLGLWTVWPMAIGVAMAALWWPGLIRSFGSTHRWVGVSWIVLAVLYLDAAVDSPLNLSVLYFRGQDRIAVPLAMICIILMVPGAAWWVSRLRLATTQGARAERFAAMAACAAVLLSATSVPARLDSAAKNLQEDYPGRGRFLQSDEVRAFAEAVDDIDGGGRILASPYSGAAHMYALHGLDLFAPVAGTALAEEDEEVIAAAPLAGRSRAACRTLLDHDIGYVYQERWLYQVDPDYFPLDAVGEDLGPVVFETDHSRLIRVDCAPR